MLERQVEQGNKRDVSVFEESKRAGNIRDEGGFDWEKTTEHYNFWNNVIENKKFDIFFEKYPKGTNPKYPKVMMVSDTGTSWCKAVVFMEKCGKYLAWRDAETIEDAERETIVYNWDLAKEVEIEPIIITMQQIAEKFGVDISQIKINPMSGRQKDS